MSWQGWNDYYYEKGREDFHAGVYNPPKDNLIFLPGAFDFDGGPVFSIADAQSAYDAGHSDAGRECG